MAREALEYLGIQERQDVSIDLDHENRQIIITSPEAFVADAGLDEEFARQVSDFIEKLPDSTRSSGKKRVKYLTPEQVLFIHSKLIQETGGSHGVRDMGMLLTAVARSRATFDQKELYPDLYSKAAALFQSLVGNHPFLDGNRRTAIASAGLFLQMNGKVLSTTQDELEHFTLKAAKGEITSDEVISWFKENSHRQFLHG